jgi:hypothetical protein
VTATAAATEAAGAAGLAAAAGGVGAAGTATVLAGDTGPEEVSRGLLGPVERGVRPLFAGRRVLAVPCACAESPFDLEGVGADTAGKTVRGLGDGTRPLVLGGRGKPRVATEDIFAFSRNARKPATGAHLSTDCDFVTPKHIHLD